MKVLIYIPKSIKEIENCKNCPLAIQGVCAELRETAPKEGKRVNCPVMAEIPDNATNGDMIKALFPDVDIMRGVGTNYVGLAVKGKDITADWLNAPYKSESDKSADTFEKLLNSGFYERGD